MVGGGEGRGAAATGSALLNGAAGVEEGGAMGGGHSTGWSWGQTWGTGVVIGWRGTASIGLELTCAGRRCTPMQNRGGRGGCQGPPRHSPKRWRLNSI
jgi:hypothetical protein